MALTLEYLRLQAYLFLLAVPFHLIWEAAQMSFYDFPESSLMTNIFGCFVPSLGDGLMTLIIYWSGWLLFRDFWWILNPRVKGYFFIIGAGLILALVVEWNALYRTGAWSYNEKMIWIPIFGVGLSPILQMVLLPPATVLLLQWVWKKRR